MLMSIPTPIRMTSMNFTHHRGSGAAVACERWSMLLPYVRLACRLSRDLCDLVPFPSRKIKDVRLRYWLSSPTFVANEC